MPSDRLHYLAASILVVDDEPSNVRLLCRLLERCGYHDVRATTDPRQALDWAAVRPPDVVLLDLHMPGLDGLTVLRTLQQAHRDEIPFVLMLTGDGTQQLRAKALANGARDFLAKPFDTNEVMLRINNLADLRLSHLALRKQNMTLEDRVRDRTQELEAARIDVIERLALAAEYRDDDTGQHTRRVGHCAAALAAHIGLAQSEVELIARGAPLHDIGKIAIPDDILRKPGPLTASEQQTMQNHTIIGAHLLSAGHSILLEVAREIALTHHERWDGNGYPNRLSQTAIPLTGRIVAICDVYDALSHDRPYRRRYSEQAVRDYISAERGSQFDPELVDVFLQRGMLTERNLALSLDRGRDNGTAARVASAPGVSFRLISCRQTDDRVQPIPDETAPSPIVQLKSGRCTHAVPA
ncbi:MAG: HD domain-containing phosphohydrolase [Gemmatimonadota bacterium]